MRWLPIFALIGIVLWSPAGISAKVERFTDKEGTLHISNEAPAEPGKPGGVKAPAPIGLPPPQILPPSTPPAPFPSPQILPPPVPGSDGEAQPAPDVPPTHAPEEEK